VNPKKMNQKKMNQEKMNQEKNKNYFVHTFGLSDKE